MNVKKLLKENRREIIDLAARHGARNVRLFGSAARGEETESSDIDLLVQVGPDASPWFPAGLILDLEELLGLRVDIVTEDSIHWLLRRRILKEAVPL
jgi:hypothetical protein